MQRWRAVWILYWLFLALSCADRSDLSSLLYARDDIECFTNMPIGVMNMKRSFERRAVQEYRLRACNQKVLYNAVDGSNINRALTFLHTGILELALNRTIEIMNKKKPETLREISIAPQAVRSRQQIVSRIKAFSSKSTRILEHQIVDILYWWQMGNVKEQSLFYSSYDLMWELAQLAEKLPPSVAPCIVTLEDDAVSRVTSLHARSLRQLCLSAPADDGWQLMWFPSNPEYYRTLAKENVEDYLADQGIDRPEDMWASTGMMWRVDKIASQLKVLVYDNETQEFWLNCTARGKCITDHFFESYSSLKVPVTQWISNPFLDHSTFHKDKLPNNALSVKTLGSVAYGFEWQSYGTATAALVDGFDLQTHVMNRADHMYEALKSFHKNPDIVAPSVRKLAGHIILKLQI